MEIRDEKEIARGKETRISRGLFEISREGFETKKIGDRGRKKPSEYITATHFPLLSKVFACPTNG